MQPFNYFQRVVQQLIFFLRSVQQLIYFLRSVQHLIYFPRSVQQLIFLLEWYIVKLLSKSAWLYFGISKVSCCSLFKTTHFDFPLSDDRSGRGTRLLFANGFTSTSKNKNPVIKNNILA